MVDKAQPGDAAKAAEFARALGEPIGCRMCGHPMQGKHMQCVNPKCMWRDTTLADQTGIVARTIEERDGGENG